MVSIGTLLAFVIVCAGVMDPARTSGLTCTRLQRSAGCPFTPIMGILVCLRHDGCVCLSILGCDSSSGSLIGMVIYYTYGRHHSKVQHAKAAQCSGKTGD